VDTSLQYFFDLSTDLLCIRNESGYFQEANSVWIDVLGWTIDELRSRPWIEFVHPNDIPEALEMEVQCQAVALKCAVQYKSRYRHRDGTYRWLSWQLSSYHEGLSYGIAQDVSERSWSGSAMYRAGIQEALQLRDQAIAASSVGIVIADAALPDMPLIYVNPAFERMTGYSASEVMGTNCRFLQGQDREQPVIDELRAAIFAGKNCTVVLRNYRKDGTLFWNELNISPICDTQGKLTHFVGVQTDITDRKRAETALRIEREKSEQLLLNILPKPIAEQLKQYQSGVNQRSGEAFIAERFEAVTVLFADIVGFTEFASQISPQKLVGLLNQIFSIFDGLTDQYGLEKIKTIGDTYMAVGGLPVPRLNHAEAIADMALEMQYKTAQFIALDNQKLRLRIGIHTGAVVAGVIGTKKFSYDLWGDTVNVASRMESQGIPGRIQVTPAIYDLLKAQYQFEARGTIAVKGRGSMTTYWLIARNHGSLERPS
jgi:adenylate cyclase